MHAHCCCEGELSLVKLVHAQPTHQTTPPDQPSLVQVEELRQAEASHQRKGQAAQRAALRHLLQPERVKLRREQEQGVGPNRGALLNRTADVVTSNCENTEGGWIATKGCIQMCQPNELGIIHKVTQDMTLGRKSPLLGSVLYAFRHAPVQANAVTAACSTKSME
jgi:hypothetical protein